MNINKVALVWSTVNGDQLIVDMARVSSDKPPGEPGEKLIKYLIDHEHWSPFEMCNMCVSIETTRDISHQLIRHRSFTFQEFSQRYAEVVDFASVYERGLRVQHPTNRQSSLPMKNEVLEAEYQDEIADNVYCCIEAYKKLIKSGIAKECARAVLPEGYTMTHLYMNGTVRSWIHYLKARTYEGTQAEHRDLAFKIKDVFMLHYPTVYQAVFNE